MRLRIGFEVDELRIVAGAMGGGGLCRERWGEMLTASGSEIFSINDISRSSDAGIPSTGGQVIGIWFDRLKS